MNRKSNQQLLREFLLRRLEINDKALFPPAESNDVTALLYFFRKNEERESYFRYSVAAILETWRHCGTIKTVIVTNSIFESLSVFASKHTNVEIQEENSLLPGDINTMSIDCNSKLYTRFNTKFVLIIQDDGFPIRKGLSRFLNTYDFIGASYVCRDTLFANTLCRLLHYNPSNGGFSIRSRKCCELAAYYWNKKYHSRPFCEPFIEDKYITEFLPTHEIFFNRAIHIAPPKIAKEFSHQIHFMQGLHKNPFGFHSADTFPLIKNHIEL